MKQSFTLKAVALGLAAVATLGASAVRPQVSLNAAAPLNSRAELSSVKKANIRSKAMYVGAQSYSTLASRKISVPNENQTQVQQPVSRAGINPYGPWEDAGTLTYTFNNLFDGEGPTKTYNYQKRVNSANANNFQIKISDWGAMTSEENDGQGALPGCELVLTVTPGVVNIDGETVNGVTTTNLTTNASEGLPLGWKAAGPDNTVLDMYFFDHATWANEIYKAGLGSADFAKSWAGSSYYEPATGKFTIQPIYGGSGDNLGLAYPYGVQNSSGAYTKYWYDYIQLSGKFYNYDAEVDADAGYFYRNAGETNGFYKAPFAINDNAVGVVKLLNKKITDAEFNAEFNTMLSAINTPTSDMAVLTSPEGWLQLPVAPYEDGNYTLLFGFSDGVEDAQGMIGFKGTYYDLVLDGKEFVLDGYAKYTDCFVPGFLKLLDLTTEDLGLPAVYTTTCQVEKSETTAGLYRLRAPFAEYPGEDVGLDYMQVLDYLYYNVADPSKAVIEPSMLGIWMRVTLQQGGQPQVLVMGGSTTSVASGMEVNNGFGIFADNKLTFPGENYTTTVNDKERVIGPLSTLFLNMTTEGQDMYIVVDKPGDCTIETGVVDAIENVEASADVNAPVEFYNLQGQKVVNPAAGQLVIKKQGSKVTKMIAQ